MINKLDSDEDEFLRDDSTQPQFSFAELKLNEPSKEKSSSVLVENISAEISHKEINQFFSFCGDISALSVMPDPMNDSKIRVIITFGSPSSARVALLLHASVFNNNIITVCEIPMIEQSDVSTTVSPSLSLPTPPSTIPTVPTPPDPKDQTVMESIIDKGYQLSNGAVQKAKEFDPNSITSRMNQGWNDVQKQVNDFDKQFQVTEKSHQITKSFQEGYQQIDNSYNISGNMQRVGSSLFGFFKGTAQTLSSSIESASGSLDQYIESHPEVKNKLDNVKSASVDTYKQVSDYVTTSTSINKRFVN